MVTVFAGSVKLRFIGNAVHSLLYLHCNSAVIHILKAQKCRSPLFKVVFPSALGTMIHGKLNKPVKQRGICNAHIRH